MSTIVDLDTGQVLGVVDGRDSKGVGEWLFARPLAWRLGVRVQVVAMDPSAAFRKALRMWLPRAAVSVDHFHLSMLANNMLTEVRQRMTQDTKGRRGRAIDPVWANRRLRLKGEGKLSDRAGDRLVQMLNVSPLSRTCTLSTEPTHSPQSATSRARTLDAIAKSSTGTNSFAVCA